MRSRASGVARGAGGRDALLRDPAWRAAQVVGTRSCAIRRGAGARPYRM